MAAPDPSPEHLCDEEDKEIYAERRALLELSRDHGYLLELLEKIEWKFEKMSEELQQDLLASIKTKRHEIFAMTRQLHHADTTTTTTTTSTLQLMNRVNADGTVYVPYEIREKILRYAVRQNFGHLRLNTITSIDQTVAAVIGDEDELQDLRDIFKKMLLRYSRFYLRIPQSAVWNIAALPEADQVCHIALDGLDVDGARLHVAIINHIFSGVRTCMVHYKIPCNPRRPYTAGIIAPVKDLLRCRAFGLKLVADSEFRRHILKVWSWQTSEEVDEEEKRFGKEVASRGPWFDPESRWRTAKLKRIRKAVHALKTARGGSQFPEIEDYMD